MTAPLIYARSPNSRQFAYAMASAWNVGTWLPNPDYALSQDPATWEIIQRDPVISQAIEHRLHRITTLDPTIVPGEKTTNGVRAAAIFQSVWDAMEGCVQARYNSTKAVLTAQTFQFMGGEQKRIRLGGANEPMLNWWMPGNIEDVDRRRFQFVPVRPDEPGAPVTGYGKRLQMFAISTSQWVNVDPRWFIRLTYDETEGRLGYGSGILGAVYFHHYAKGIVLRELLQGIERWAQGLTVVKLKAARLASAGKTNEQQRRKWLDTIEKMRARNGLVMEDGDDVKVEWPSGTAGEIALDTLRYIDDTTRGRINGSVMPLGGGSSGNGGDSDARSKTEVDESQMIVKFDRRLLDEAWTRDLVGLFWHNNANLLHALGLGDTQPPKIQSIAVEEEDPDKFLDRAKKAHEMGAPICQDEFYKRSGFRQPKPGEPVIGGAMPVAPGGLPLTDPTGKLKDPQQRVDVAAAGEEHLSEEPVAEEPVPA